MSQNGGGGCMAQIIGGAVIVLVAFLISLFNESQFHLIRQARKNNTIGSYRVYLDKYPSGRYSTEAYNTVVSLWDAMDFENFQNSTHGCHKAINSYEGLYANYDDTSFKAQLYDKMKAKCEKQYQIASSLNTFESWHKYITIVPEDFIFDANERYQNKYNQAWGTEKSAWEYACYLNTIAGYEEYEKNHPNGRHYAEAEKRAVSMRVDHVFSGQYESLPSMSRTSYGASAKSRVTVTNSTEYTLTLYYSGIDGKRMEIRPHGTQSVTLTNGQYRIAASVNSTRVRSYAGVETLNGGDYDIKYYIQTGPRRY